VEIGSVRLAGRRVARAWRVAVAAALVAGCGPPDGPPDLILVSVDTLRPDHLSAYGYERETSPHLDELARESVRFDTAIAQAPSTLPSHASILTSLPPSRHRALFTHRRRLRDEVTTVAEVLRDAGYRTAAFVDGGQLSPEFHLDQGFDVYASPSGSLRRAVSKAFEWLDAQPPGGPVFLFLHTYEVHHPYRPEPEHMDPFDADYQGDLPDHIEVELLEQINGDREPRLEIDEADLQHVVNAYDAGIVHMDLGIRSLVRELRERDRWKNTAIVFTSDHGEEFGEHGRVGWHSQALFDEQVRVPLLLRLPRGRHGGERVEAQVRSMDIAPTLLALAGVPAPAAFEGRSLLARLGPEADTEPWIARSERDRVGDPLSTSLRDGRFKWYDGRLYDLAADPEERVDVREREPERAAGLEAEYHRGLESVGDVAADAPAVDLPEQTREGLRALGYLD